MTKKHQMINAKKGKRLEREMDDKSIREAVARMNAADSEREGDSLFDLARKNLLTDTHGTAKEMEI